MCCPCCRSAAHKGGAETSVTIGPDLTGLARLAGVLAGGSLVALLRAILALLLGGIWGGSALIVALLVGSAVALAGRRGRVAGLGRVRGIARLLGRARLIPAVALLLVVIAVALRMLGVLLLEA